MWKALYPARPRYDDPIFVVTDERAGTTQVNQYVPKNWAGVYWRGSDDLEAVVGIAEIVELIGPILRSAHLVRRGQFVDLSSGPNPHVEVPLVTVANAYRNGFRRTARRANEKSDGPTASVAQRFALSVWPAPKPEADLTALHHPIHTELNLRRLNLNSFGHVTVNIAAAPGIRIDPVPIDSMEPYPRINIFRTQDVGRIPPPGAPVEAGSFLQSFIWGFRSEDGAAEIFLNPTAKELRKSASSFWIEGLERPNGIDFVVLNNPGSRHNRLGFLVEIRVDPYSADDVFWYGVRIHRGQLRLQIARSPSVQVRVRPIPPKGKVKEPEPGETTPTAPEPPSPTELLYLGADEGVERLDRAVDYSGRTAGVRLIAKEVVELFDLEHQEHLVSMPVPTLVPHDRGPHPLEGIKKRRSDPKITTATVGFVSQLFGLSDDTADAILETAVGFVPFLSDGYDIMEFAHALESGRTLSGDQVGWLDWLGMGVGIFALGLDGLGPAIELASRAKKAKGFRQTRDWQHLLEEAADGIDDVDRKWLAGKLGEFAADGENLRRVDSLADLPPDDIVRLRGILAGVQAKIDDSALRQVLTFDSLLGGGAFKSQVLEARYMAATGGGTLADRKRWLRQIAHSTDPEHGRLADLVKRTIGDRSWRIETIDPQFHQHGYTGAVQEYMEAILDDPSGGVKGLRWSWDYDRFPVPDEDIALELPFDFGWKRGLPTDMPLKYKGKWVVPDYDVHGVHARHRCWNNAMYAERNKRLSMNGLDHTDPDARLAIRKNALLTATEDGFDPEEVKEALEFMAMLDSGKTVRLADYPQVWPKRINEIDPIGALPDWYIEFQLRRLERSANSKVPGGPALKVWIGDRAVPFVLDHENVPRRALRLAMGALVGRGDDALRNELRILFGSVSPHNLRAKSPIENAWTDGHVYGLGVSNQRTRRGDSTYMRWFAETDDETVQRLIGLAKDAPDSPRLRELKWNLNQEIGSRNLPEFAFDEVELPLDMNADRLAEIGSRRPLRFIDVVPEDDVDAFFEAASEAADELD